MSFPDSMQPDDFQSDEQIDNVFVRKRAFSDESPAQTTARAEWMLTRQKAVFFLFSLELGVDIDTAARLAAGFNQLARSDTNDFILSGLDADHDWVEIHHPLNGVIHEMLDAITEPADDRILARDRSCGSWDKIDDIQFAADEDLIHMIAKHVPPEL